MANQLNNRVRRSRLKCCGLALAIPLALFILVAGVFVFNNRPPNIKVPTHKMPKDNGWNYFVKAGKMISKADCPGPVSSSRPQSSWTIPEYGKFMRANAPALVVAREGLTKSYMYPSVRSYDYYNNAFTHLARCRELGRTLLSEAMYYRVVGKPAKAADSLLDCIELGVIMPRGGTQMASLVGVAVEAIGMHGFPKTLAQLNTSDLARVAKRIETIQGKRAAYADVVMEEGNASTAMNAGLFRLPNNLRETANPMNWIDTATVLSGPESPLADFWHGARFAFANKRAMLRENQAYYKAVAEEMRHPYTGKSQVPVPDNPFANGLMAPNLLMGQASALRAEAMLNLLQTKIAIRRYRLDNGRYPDQLAQLIPKYLKKEPIDPFGQWNALRYRALNGGKSFLVYSLGPNLRDDGGKPAKSQADKMVTDVLQGKWRGDKTPGDILLEK